jgi:hypothetical protein
MMEAGFHFLIFRILRRKIFFIWGSIFQLDKLYNSKIELINGFKSFSAGEIDFKVFKI